MTAARFGALIGGGLAVVWAAFGFWVFVGVAAAALVGYLVARVLGGEVDLARLADALRGRRSSS
ncbi:MULTISPECIES: hypothetical protein [Leifsonia]|uniref:DUF2273 domain-containing protein n=1 Tax=Leifsonia soli TaxID=582665 RepID=A0A852T0R3_9MICO|nr:MULTISPECIES: hypothetical protein [Leifsonia]NYD75019.1 hypothetical protein [Leifsonia soli]SEA38962.1 hypothetical protein SAMN04515680_0205 [Leifsonia sp. 21MFCrub1.1]